MKILFLLGSLEAKKNGVADYVLNLTDCLEKLGHQIAIISINDYKCIVLKIEDVNIITSSKIRLSSDLSMIRKKSIIKEFVNTFQPDLISLQFVSFAFQKKGLPFSLLNVLSGIKQFPLHIMFHELWVDYNSTKSLKKYILGKLQKFCILFLIKHLKPIEITSSIPFYIAKLKKYSANLLPLFGNIKPIDYINLTKQKNELNVVFLGSFSPNISDFITQLNWLKNYSIAHKLNIKFNVIGNNGVNKAAAFLQIKNILGRYALNYIGERSAEQVSETFLNADIGISRADYKYFGKSGSTLAMLEHGLPVLLRGEKPETFYNDKPLNSFTNQLLFTSNSLNILPVKLKSNSQQMMVAKKFISIINNNLQTKK